MMDELLHASADPTGAPATDRFVVLPRSFLMALHEAGIDAGGLARELGVASVSGRLPVTQAEAFLERALDHVEDPAFGLVAGADVQPELFSVAGYAAMTAPTFGEALARLARFKRMLWIDGLEFTRSDVDGRVRVLLAGHARHARLRADAELAFIVAFGRRLTRYRQLSPLRVELRGPAPPHRQQYEELFRCQVSFECPADEALFAAGDLRRPLVSHAPELARFFGDQAERTLEEHAGGRVEGRVRAELRRALGEGPRIDAVAASLGTSARTLQRQLAAERTSFAALLDETRCEVASELLARTSVDMAEISFMIGFSDPNVFYRAFKRWRGVTPLAYRRQHLHPSH